jgi:hypothetical protein
MSQEAEGSEPTSRAPDGRRSFLPSWLNGSVDDRPQGRLVRFMRANVERLLDGAGETARLAKQETTAVRLTIAVSCIGRLSPYLNGRCELRNKTMTLTTLGRGLRQCRST